MMVMNIYKQIIEEDNLVVFTKLSHLDYFENNINGAKILFG